MLIGKIGKAFEPTSYRPARDLGKHPRQDREEHYGDDRGEHRGASRGAAGNDFLSSLIASNCWHLIGSHFKRKMGVKVDCKSGCQRLEG